MRQLSLPLLRKVLVNDAVHSFCYAARTGEQFPFVLVDFANWPAPAMPIDNCVKQGFFSPFIDYVMSREKNYVLAMRKLVLFASCAGNFSEAEQEYALQVFNKYYVKQEAK